MNKLISLTWLLWALKFFSEIYITLHSTTTTTKLLLLLLETYKYLGKTVQRRFRRSSGIFGWKNDDFGL